MQNDQRLTNTTAKVLSICLVMAVACVTTPAAYAGEKIEGAYGIKLGSVFSPTNAFNKETILCFFPINESRSEERQTTVYHVSVTNKPKVFHNFWVEITPKSQKIYRISLSAGELTKTEREELENTLLSKYDNDKASPTAGFWGVLVNQGNRLITLKSETISSVYINMPSTTRTLLTYVDRELLHLAEKETAEAAFKGAGGL